MEHDTINRTRLGLTRTGRRSGCSCCSFTALGLFVLPIVAVVAFFLVG